MSDWMLWFAIAGALIVLEMFTGTFYLLMVGIGFSAGGLTALAGGSGAVQLAVAAIVGVLATYALRRSKWGTEEKRNAAGDPDVNLDIGQTLVVKEWESADGEPWTARSTYRGAEWDVELEPGGKATPGTFVIREVRGSRLIVGRGGSNH